MKLRKNHPEKHQARIAETVKTVSAKSDTRGKLETAMNMLIADVENAVKNESVTDQEDLISTFKANLGPWMDMVLAK